MAPIQDGAPSLWPVVLQVVDSVQMVLAREVPPPREAVREAELESQARRLLFDYRWLDAKLRARDVNRLLHDFEGLAERDVARLVESALRLSAHVLDQHPAQLAPQLTGRLLAVASSEVSQLVDSIAQAPPTCWLVPQSADLTPPGQSTAAQPPQDAVPKQRRWLPMPHRGAAIVHQGPAPAGRDLAKGASYFQPPSRSERPEDAFGEMVAALGQRDPTAAAVAGVRLPDGKAIDGVNLIPCLTHSGPSPAEAAHEVLFWRMNMRHALRMGDWKVVRRGGAGSRGDQWELYNLADDPNERQNLVNEPGQQARIAELKALLEQQLREPEDE